MNLEDQLKELLSKSLPAIQAEAVIEQLNKTAALEKELKECKSSLKFKDESYSIHVSKNYDLQQQLDAYKERELEISSKEKSLAERELQCESRERNMEMERMKIKLEQEMKRNDDLFNLTSQVFASPVIKQNGHMTIRDNYGNHTMLPFEQCVKQETETETIHRHIIQPGNNVTDPPII